jgi:hypothetical protein
MFGTQEIDDCVALPHLNGKGKETKWIIKKNGIEIV